ncbi:hypothetical protein GBAR_LOCUS665 [Geodia barretti]|uniref:Uncharacterized protein n=1 Tax=Geodia barretti TaxID=519541 RepID=A0AA35QTL4_GEOBA|nr:hypothetical protein GBAR_LOCUS665 [Geodia barretti]
MSSTSQSCSRVPPGAARPASWNTWRGNSADPSPRLPVMKTSPPAI